MEPDAPEPSRSAPSSSALAIWTVLAASLLASLLLFADRCSLGLTSARAYPSRTLPPEPVPVLLPAPPVDEEYFPCSDCHEGEETNRTVRLLEEEHAELEFKHGELWCFHCHDPEDRDRLRLADGRLVPFEESWQLCTQCHAQKLASWQAGIHGKRTGYWWGPKEYRTCTACHGPHSPRFEQLEPKPPPKRAEEIQLIVRSEESVPHEGE